MGRKKAVEKATLRITIDVEILKSKDSLLETNAAVVAALKRSPGSVASNVDLRTVVLSSTVAGMAYCFPGGVFPPGLIVRDAQCHFIDALPQDELDASNARLHGKPTRAEIEKARNAAEDLEGYPDEH